MSTKMLIDARHPEEVRVVIMHGNRVEDFDFEAAEKRQLKGNIYLAKVTRVEPSLQAAFVEYGGNRHGFLAFSEIHPDYYQIPIADREQLLREEADAIAAEDEEYAESPADIAQAAPPATENGSDDQGEEEHDADGNGDGENEEAPMPATVVGGHDDAEELSAQSESRRRRTKRRYKIQEVIKRRQVLLVQVVKEERGSKGAALTTYLSLAGRYCVLMPNATSGGGISRKIASGADRRRLKSIMSDLSVPDGMGCIIRTAGMERTKIEIKRDFDYLLRLWDDIRELTLKSVAPALIYEEGDLIKRSIRDLYTREIDEVLVEGDDGYRNAKNFMRMLMPSHAKKVKPYKDRIPLLQRYKIEAQLDTMFQPTVQLKSGGYIVINPTEALVAIDVNSGKATREHNIEETALKTNCEAAEEVARQLRLRDMAGLVVIDFIDMENRGNIKTVERKLRDALKNDRARVQVGRISNFGLMEMSRQRLRPGMLEASTHTCPVCRGAGMVRSVSSAALHAIRVLEEEGLRGRASHLTISLAPEVAIYILNHKRETLRELETQYGLRIDVLANANILSPDFELTHAGGPPERPALPAQEAAPVTEDVIDDDDASEEAEEHEVEEATASTAVTDEEKAKKRRRRRRPRRKDDSQAATAAQAAAPMPAEPEEIETNGESAPESTAASTAEDDGTPRKRRPRRRGGRGRRGGKVTNAATDSAEAIADDDDQQDVIAADTADTQAAATGRDEDGSADDGHAGVNGQAPLAPRHEDVTPPVETAKPAPAPDTVTAVADAASEQAVSDAETPLPAPSGPPAPPRRGWWQRTFDR